MQKSPSRISEIGFPTRRRPYVPRIAVTEEARNAESVPADSSPAAVSPLLTLQDLSRVLRLHPRTIRRMVARGRIPCVRFGRAIRFTRDDVLALLSAKKEG